jgi:hypothetical protein
MVKSPNATYRPGAPMSNVPELVLQNNPAAAELASFLRKKVDDMVGQEGTFSRREQVALELTNEAVRRMLEQDLQQRADRQAPELLIDGVRCRQHEPGTVAYHSLCGPLRIRRYTYRAVGVRNGPTLAPLELETGLIEGATPALAYDVAQAYAKNDMRSHHEDLLAARRIPPSRTTLEAMAKSIGHQAQVHVPQIEPLVRQQEAVPQQAQGLTLGLDRTSVPMEEERAPGQAPKTRRKVRSKPYVRKAPPPVDVNWRMAYVGTVTLHDAEGHELISRRYTALPHEEPEVIVNRIMADVQAYRDKRPDLNIAVLQDGAPELWNAVRPALSVVTERWDEAIDRFHLEERLGEALGLLPIDSTERRRLWEAWTQRLDQDDEAIDAIESTLRAWHGKLDPVAAGKLWEHLVYLRNNKDRMRYASLLRKGLPIGSGITEAACKSVIGQRTAGSGQRWHDEGLAAVLTLRALHRSDRLPSFWEHFARLYTRAICMAA